MLKVINIIMGIIIIAVVAAGGALAYVYMRPSSAVSSKLDWDLKKWQEQVNERPDDPLARANLGLVYLDMGKAEEAIKELETAVELAPEGYTYIYSLGRAYRDSGQADLALEKFLQCMELYPAGEKFPIAFKIAEIYLEKGDTAAAKDYVQQSIADNELTWNSRYMFGQILEQEGDLVKAREQYDIASKLNPGNTELEEALKRVSAQ